MILKEEAIKGLKKRPGTGAVKDNSGEQDLPAIRTPCNDVIIL